MIKILKHMKEKTHKSFSDQVNIMNYVVNNEYILREEECVLNGIKFMNKIIEIDNITPFNISNADFYGIKNN